MKLSIITVVYNNLNCIEETILNVLKTIGERNDIEYIVIDGKSTDGTLDIIKKYQDKITLWISEPDKGIYDAMNKGVLLAKGEWINFMNAGDEFAIPNFDLFSDPKVCEECDIIYGDVLFKRDGKLTLEKANPIDQINYSLNFCHQSSFVKTELLRNYPFSLDYRISSDYEFFLKTYILGYNFYYVDRLISVFEYGGVSSGISKKFIKERLSIIFKTHNGLKNKVWFVFKFLKTLFPYNRKIIMNFINNG